MMASWISPMLVGALLTGTSTPEPVGLETAAHSTRSAAVEVVPEVAVPHLYIEGQPFVVSVKYDGSEAGEETKIPVHLLGPSAWLMDTKPLVRREGEGELTLLPGQSIETSLDLAPLIEKRLEDDNRDFRIQFAEGASSLGEVIHLALPETGVDFIELPKEQLEDYQVVLDTNEGPIWMELWPDVAPGHVRNFLDLCSSGFYDGIEFHRTIPGFMVQSGKAKDGSEAPRKLAAEFSRRPHVAGVLSMARLGNDINSATSEFFIIHQDAPQLDGNFTAFGATILGTEAIESIVHGADARMEMASELSSAGIELGANKDAVDFIIHKPSSPKLIRQALVVKATKTRPAKADKKDDKGR